MSDWRGIFRPAIWLIALPLLLAIVACSDTATSCPRYQPVSLSGSAAFVGDNNFPFRFPLDGIPDGTAPRAAPFAAYGDDGTGGEYHAAEDYDQQPGTPVYAMADGEVSFSGRMGGYGWLVIVDHPQANLYSLYGHLSPSRWQIERGPVEKGTLLGYLGDDDENGGSASEPLIPHLHLGIRAGQRSDYSSQGEWRWMAGWIKPCPQDLGWLQPSLIITGQQIPAGGFQAATGDFLQMWAIELLFTSFILTGGIFGLIYGVRKDKPWFLAGYGLFIAAACVLLNNKGYKATPLIFAMAALYLVAGLTLIVRRRRSGREQPS